MLQHHLLVPAHVLVAVLLGWCHRVQQAWEIPSALSAALLQTLPTPFQLHTEWEGPPGEEVWLGFSGWFAPGTVPRVLFINMEVEKREGGCHLRWTASVL